MSKRIRLRAYPKSVSVICFSQDVSSVMNLAKGISGSAECGRIFSSSLIYSGKLCLALSLESGALQKLLPILCEHSDSVCIGRGYPEIASEHGYVMIESGALGILSSEAFNGSSHIV